MMILGKQVEGALTLFVLIFALFSPKNYNFFTIFFFGYFELAIIPFWFIFL